MLGSKVRQLTNSDGWSKRAIGRAGADMFYVVLRTKCIDNSHNELSRNLMENGTDDARSSTPAVARIGTPCLWICFA